MIVDKLWLMAEFTITELTSLFLLIESKQFR